MGRNGTTQLRLVSPDLRLFIAYKGVELLFRRPPDVYVYDECSSPSPLLNTAIVSEYAIFMQVATFSRSFRVKRVRYTSLLLYALLSLSSPHLILSHGFSTLSFGCDGKTGGIELGRDHAKQKKNRVL